MIPLKLPDNIRFAELYGTQYYIGWEHLMVGSSFFLPTTATPGQAMKALRRAKRYFNIELEAHARLEHGLYGVRVWRLA